MRTQEEIDEELAVAREYMDALRRKDRKAADRILPRVKFEACSLKATKRLFGADYIRRRGYNTEKADREFGPDWLDHDDGPAFFDRHSYQNG